MLHFLRSFLPLKPKSLESLIEVVKINSCDTVMIMPTTVVKKGGVMTAAVGVLGDFRYMLEVTTDMPMPSGRHVMYTKCVVERSGSERGVADQEERAKATLKHFLFGERMMNELRAQLPGVNIWLVDPTGQEVMTETGFAKLHTEAATVGVSI